VNEFESKAKENEEKKQERLAQVKQKQEQAKKAQQTNKRKNADFEKTIYKILLLKRNLHLFDLMAND